MIAWLVDTAISLTILMALVLAARGPVARFCGAGWAYALWAIPLLRLFLPAVEWPGSAPSPMPALIVIPEQSGAAMLSSAAEAGFAWAPVLLALWLGGVAMFAMWQQSDYSAFLLSLGKTPNPADPPSHGGIDVVESGAVDGPIAVGFLRRWIVVPLDFARRYRPAERALALDHELIHHRRGDLWWNLAALVLLGLNWFNPLAWVAYRAFRSDQELACDAAVAAHMDGGRGDYAAALVKASTRPGQIAACPLNRADQLKRRLKMIKQHRASPARTAGGVLALGGFAAIGLFVAGPGFAQSEAPQPNVVVAAPEVAEPIIAKSDMAILKARCRGNSAGRDDLIVNDDSDGVVCTDADAKDPEVRRIMEKTEQRAEAYAERATQAALRSVEIAKVAKKAAAAASAQAAAVAVPAIDHAEIRRSVEQAMRAVPRVRVVRVPRPAHAPATPHAPFAPPSPPEPAVVISAVDHEEIAAAVAEADAEARAHIEAARADIEEARAEMLSQRIDAEVHAKLQRALARSERQLEREMRALDQRLRRLDVQIERDVQRALEAAGVDDMS